MSAPEMAREHGQHITGVSVHGIALVGALELWATRDDPHPDRDAYSAASVAVTHIDAMLAELHQLRAQLVTEHRQFGDAAMARSAELLDRRRDGNRPIGDLTP